ncbi:MAG: carbohydrate ABC transporter permease [Candidatus Methanosuratus sp.]|nr:carbohydrate ABC transporter permease [Candidatus Methanosuratincola sp.]
MQRTTNPVARFIIYLILILFSIYSILPFFWTTLQSFKTVRQAMSRTPLFIFKPTWANYERLWLEEVPENLSTLLLALFGIGLILALIVIVTRRLSVRQSAVWLLVFAVVALILWMIPRIVHTAEFYQYFLNSLIVTIGTVVISISIGCLAGYALARYSGIEGLIILIVALGFRALPRMSFALPYFWIGQATKLHDTYILLILSLVAVNQPFTIWMLRSFFMEIPKDIEESAMIDGCNRLTAFLRVIIPIAWPGIISTGLFSLLLAYNEFLIVRVLTQTKWTLPVAIAQFTGGEDPGYITLAAAAAISASLPIVIVILIFQKHLVKGLAAGAVKG